jgi:hypothetical protein
MISKSVQHQKGASIVHWLLALGVLLAFGVLA